MSQPDERAVEIFPPETLRRLHDAVDINDVVDAKVALPERAATVCTQAQLRRCLALCIQFWERGVDRAALLQLVDRLLRGEVLDATQRLAYKHIRAKYKQLRNAQTLYGVRHRVDFWMQWTVRILGKLQDAFRGDRRLAVVAYGTLLKCLLARPVWTRVERGVRRTRLDTAAGFVAYRQREMQRLQRALGRTTLTGHEFHAMRKIISRQVSFYDAIRSLDPADAHAYQMSRFLSAINGLMGARHDEMLAQALAGERPYRTPTPVAADIRQRLEALASYWRNGP